MKMIALLLCYFLSINSRHFKAALKTNKQTFLSTTGIDSLPVSFNVWAAGRWSYQAGDSFFAVFGCQLYPKQLPSE